MGKADPAALCRPTSPALKVTQSRFEIDSANELPQACACGGEQFKPDDHSELVPLLPIPNRTVKRLSADDSADSRVKVGHRQATYTDLKPLPW